MLAEAIQWALRRRCPVTGSELWAVSAAWGQDRFDTGAGFSRTHELWGLALGGGVAIHIGKRLDLRPQVRTFALSGLHFFAAGAVGFGYRF